MKSLPLLNLLSLTPGSDMWSELVAEGRINEELYWETGVTAFEIGEGMDRATLNPIVTKALRDFFWKPRRILKTLFRFFTNSYKLRNLFRVFFSNLQNFSDFAGTRSLNVSIRNFSEPPEEGAI